MLGLRGGSTIQRRAYNPEGWDSKEGVYPRGIDYEQVGWIVYIFPEKEWLRPLFFSASAKNEYQPVIKIDLYNLYFGALDIECFHHMKVINDKLFTKIPNTKHEHQFRLFP